MQERARTALVNCKLVNKIMKNRDYKQFGQGNYYHIYNRGNNKQNIFIDDEDFTFFLTRLRQNLFPQEDDRLRIIPLPANAFTLMCYCLMPNHFHFLIRQNDQIPTTKLLSKICTSYSIYFNKKYQKVGHVFQDKFKQVLVDDNSYLLWLSAYIHLNPITAKITSNPSDYKWSSYPDFIKIRSGDGILLDKEIILSQFNNSGDYEDFILEAGKIIKEKKDLENLLLD